MTEMFRMIQDVHELYGIRLSHYPMTQYGGTFDPYSVLPDGYDWGDPYIWAVLRARNSVSIIRDDYTNLVVPYSSSPTALSRQAPRRSSGFSVDGITYLQDDNGEWVVCM